jgi:hypothetical protein
LVANSRPSRRLVVRFQEMRIVFTILATGVIIWWFVRPGSNGVQVLGGFIGDIIAFFQFLTGQPLIGSKQVKLTTPTAPSNLYVPGVA